MLAVPFLYRVHGCPDDFNRPTASWWRETLSRKGIVELEVSPLVWDGLTSGVAVVDGIAPFSRLRRLVVPLLGVTELTVGVAACATPTTRPSTMRGSRSDRGSISMVPSPSVALRKSWNQSGR
jgi:hypothetical protein